MTQAGPRYRFAAVLGESESWLSRRVTGRVEFSKREQEKIARALDYPAEWLFQEPQPPARVPVDQRHGLGVGSVRQ